MHDANSAWHVRLKHERERLWPDEQAKAADAIGIARSMLSRYENGVTEPGLGVLTKLSANGVDVLYVLTGRREAAHPVRPDTTHPGAPPTGGAVALAASCLLAPAGLSIDRPMTLPVRFAAGNKIREYQVIPKFQADASAGKVGARRVDSNDLHADVAGVMALEVDYMQQALGRAGPGFITVTVSGDSMEPTLADGDVIIVDTTRTAVDASGIYVVELGGDLLVKRVQRRMDGSLVLKSDNAAYDPEHIQPDAAHALRVLGRMARLRVR